jgi:hypothetical protein
MNKDETEEKILKALENPKFRWRTIRGLARETEISPEIIRTVVTIKSDRVVMASAPNTKGEALFTSRHQRRRQAGTLRRIVSALKNRGD